MGWYACSTAPWMFLGTVMMGFFVLACVAMMFFVLRRHAHPVELGGMPMNGMSHWGMRLGPWRTITGMNAPKATPSAAFEEYRQPTLHRLEQEKAENFLDELRSAKDKAEFAQFMVERQSTATKSA